MSQPLTITAVGDVRVDHRKAGRATPEDAFALCRDVFQSSDINFFNCEGVYTDRVVTVPSQHTPSSTPPENYRAMEWAGFNVTSLANNHGYDRGAEGLLDTIELSKRHGIAISGAGPNLEEARRPAMVEQKGVKVAFLSYNSVGPVEYAAKADRPGDVPMRVATVYQSIEYQPGTPCRILTFADPDDLAALLEDVRRAKEEADLVVMAFHWGMHHVQAMVHMYQQQIAHAALDAGADLVIGGHDHVVKGIEYYNGKAIFYGMGDFVIDHGGREKTQTAWRKMKQRLYDLQYDWDYPTYPFAGEARHHMIVRATVEDGRISRVSYLPCTINTGGQPFPLQAGDPRFAEVSGYIEAISRHQGFGVTLRPEGDEIVVEAGSQPTVAIPPAYTRFILDPIPVPLSGDAA